jgi:16S rRNA processing protein RimM
MTDRLLVMGRIVGVFGVEGWVKVESYAEPRENLGRYRPWNVELGGAQVLEVARPKVAAHGRGLIAKLDGVSDRDAAAALIGAEIRIARDRLPKAKAGEYYWADLEGLTVRTVAGVELGTVSHLVATGANDVIVVRGDRERWVPYTADVVLRVDSSAGFIEVDWDPEF